MSRAEKLPGIGSALGPAVLDVYYQSIRLVAANLAWGLVFVVAAWLLIGGLIGPALVAFALLAVPTAGVYALSAQTLRGEDVVLSDLARAWRRLAPPALACGALFVGAAVILVVNLGAGLRAGGILGWSLATVAAWSLAALYAYALAFWPLLADPHRQKQSVTSRARLAGLVLLGRPGAIVGLAVAVAIVTVVATILFAAIVTVAVAYAAVLACRVSLPAADRIEASLPTPTA